MSNDGGWIYLHRRILDEDFGDDIYLLGLWTFLLASAQWKKKEMKVGGKLIKLEPGQVAISVLEISSRLKIGYGVIKRRLTYLEQSERIRQTKHHNKTVITICKWNKNQGTKNQHDKQTTSGRQTDDKQTINDRQTTDKRPPKNPSDFIDLDPPNKGIRKEGNKGIKEYIKRDPQKFDQDFISEPSSFHEEGYPDLELVPPIDLFPSDFNPDEFERDFLPDMTQEDLNRSEAVLEVRLNSGCDEKIGGGSDHFDQKTIKKIAPVSDQKTIKKIAPVSDQKTIKKIATPSVEKKKRSSKKWADDNDREMAKTWADWTKENFPHIRINLDSWAEAISKTKRVVGLSHEQIEGIFSFVINDDFWSDKIQSPTSLLNKSKSNDLRKVDNILTQIKRKHFKHNKVMEYARKRDAGLIPSAMEGAAF